MADPARVLRPFFFHGVDLSLPGDGDTKAWGECPFCNHEKRKFSVNLDTTQWGCFHCGRTGNELTFLSQYHDLWLQETTDDDYRRLSDNRSGIPWESFRDHLFALDGSYQEARWLIPVFSTRNTLFGLRVYEPEQGTVVQTAGTNLALYNIEHLAHDGPIYFCEGEWDALALEVLLRRAGYRLAPEDEPQASVLGVPGMNVFKRQWDNLFLRRDLYFLYDNEPAALEHARQNALRLGSLANHTFILNWPHSIPEKFDIRDYCTHRSNDPVAAWNDLQRAMERVGGTKKTKQTLPPGVKKIPRLTFPKLALEFGKHYFLDERMQDALALMLAVVFSSHIDNDPLWLFIVGPPGSGKTLLLKAFKDSRWCVFRSSITPKSLISGYNTDPDPSLILEVIGHVLIFKDWTELLAMTRQDQDEVYAIFRGAYDGRVEKTFGNGVKREYDPCYFSMIAGVTDEIHRDSRASLGERFLKYQMVESATHDPQDHIRAAILGMADETRTETYLRNLVTAFLDRQITRADLPEIPAWVLERVIPLSMVVAVARTVVDRNWQGDPHYRPAVDVGSRLGKQLIKLAQCLSVVYAVDRITPRVWKIVIQVALDTAHGWSLDLLRQLAVAPEPLPLNQLQALADVPSTTARRRLEDLEMLKAVEHVSQKRGFLGRPQHAYRLTDQLQKLWQLAFSPPPKGA